LGCLLVLVVGLLSHFCYRSVNAVVLTRIRGRTKYASTLFRPVTMSICACMPGVMYSFLSPFSR